MRRGDCHLMHAAFCPRHALSGSQRSSSSLGDPIVQGGTSPSLDIDSDLSHENCFVVDDGDAQHFDMTVDDSDVDIEDDRGCNIREGRVAKLRPVSQHSEAPDAKRYRIIGKPPG